MEVREEVEREKNVQHYNTIKKKNEGIRKKEKEREGRRRCWKIRGRERERKKERER